MEISREMEVDLLHREYLCIASSCSSSLLSEAGPQRGLTKGNNSTLTQACHA